MTSSSNLLRRNAANLIVLRSGVPADQAGIDAMWSGIVAKLNKAVPASRTQIGLWSARSSASGPGKPKQRVVDWGSILTELKAEAGVKTPVRSRA
jgi:hypothetical protein